MSSEIFPELPIAVQDAFGIDNQSAITRLNGGLVNETMLVETEDRTFILRKLAPILGANTIRTLCAVGDHLLNAGWEAPTVESTITGEPYVVDDSHKIWHGMAHITSDCLPPEQPDAKLAKHVGELLGSWHSTVSSLEFSPESLTHFHDTDYIAKKLSDELSLLPDKPSQELAALLLADYYAQFNQLPEIPQIIHGDPKLDNMLYRNNKPFTLIDFDCVMIDSTWTDIGDFLRSLNSKLLHTREDPFKAITGFMEGYLDTAGIKLSFDEANHGALQATRRIACELGMRYLSDIVDGHNYFNWDNRQYGSRAEALFNKAHTQFEILQIVHNYLNEGER